MQYNNELCERFEPLTCLFYYLLRSACAPKSKFVRQVFCRELLRCPEEGEFD